MNTNCGLGAVEQRIVGGLLAGIPAQQAVLSELPQIARTGDGGTSRVGRHRIFRPLGELPASRASSSRISISAVSNPVSSISTLRSMRACSSIARISRSQPAFSASLLSARM